MTADWKLIFKIGAVATALSLLCSLTTLVVTVLLGPEPATPLEYFKLLNEQPLTAWLRMDFASVVNVAALFFTYFAVYGALKETAKAPLVTLATLLVFVGMTLWLSSHSGFSWLALSHKYATASNEVDRMQIMAAGEAVVATDMWHSTGSAVVGGLFSEFGALLLLLIAFRHRSFGKSACLAGIVTHGFDFVHVVVGIFSASIASMLMMVAGIGYLIFLPLLTVELWRKARS